MKKPDRGPDYREHHGAVVLREIKRPDLVKDPYRVRGQYTKSDGRPGTFDVLNWRAARDKAAEINRAIEERRTAGTGRMRFERVWKEWHATREEDCRLGHLRKGSQHKDKSQGAAGLAEFGKRKVDSIMSIDVERWAKRLASEYSHAWAMICVYQIQRVLDYAVRKRYLAFNPLRQDPVKLPNKPSARPSVPTWAMMDRLIEYGRGPRPPKVVRVTWSNLRVGIALSAGAGLRFGELAALKWSNVDFAARVLRVRESWSFYDGIGRPKTPASIRDVPVCQWLYEELLNHLHVLERNQAKPGEGMVIRNRFGADRPVSAGTWHMSFRRFLVHAGVLASEVGRSEEWHWHVLRRFYISARLAIGDNLMTVGEQVGHRDPSMTAKTYARALADPPLIWRHRLQPADPEAPTLIDGAPLPAVDHLLPAPTPAINGERTAPAWVREAVELLQGGWQIADVARHLGKARSTLNHHLHEAGLPSAQRIYRDARDRRYEQLQAQGFGASDIADMTGTSRDSFNNWRQTHEAGLPHTSKSLKTLHKSGRKKGSGATGAQQKQMSLL